MNIDKVKLDLIASLYDAAIDSNHWPALLDQLVPQLGAKGSALLMIETQERYNYSISATSSLYSEAVRRTYEQQYSRYEAEHFAKVARGPARVVTCDSDSVADPQRYRERPDVAYLRERAGVLERFALKLNDDAAWFECITFQYDQDRGNITASEQHVLDLFVPHLARSVALSRTFSILRAKFNAVLGALDQVYVGMLVVSGNAEIVCGNATAWRILEDTPGLSVSLDKRVQTANAESNGRLKQAIARASATAAAQSNAGTTLMSVPKLCGYSHVLLEISPLRDADREIDARFRGAIISIVDPDGVRPINWAGMKTLYGLTAAEIAILDPLALGKSNLEIAEIRGVSPETVKVQIRSVFSKMNVRNRAELVRRALTVNLPIEGLE